MCVSVFCSPLCAVNRAGRSPENTCEQIAPGGTAAGACPSTAMFTLRQSLNVGVDVGETARNRIALNFLLDKWPCDVEHLPPKRHSEKKEGHTMPGIWQQGCQQTETTSWSEQDRQPIMNPTLPNLPVEEHLYHLGERLYGPLPILVPSGARKGLLPTNKSLQKQVLMNSEIYPLWGSVTHLLVTPEK